MPSAKAASSSTIRICANVYPVIKPVHADPMVDPAAVLTDRTLHAQRPQAWCQAMQHARTYRYVSLLPAAWHGPQPRAPATAGQLLQRLAKNARTERCRYAGLSTKSAPLQAFRRLRKVGTNIALSAPECSPDPAGESGGRTRGPQSIDLTRRGVEHETHEHHSTGRTFGSAVISL
jgi:hypothetical protein